MLILNIKDLKKYYGNRLILDIRDFKMYSEDKIGVIGLNGCGKTTLLKLISGEIIPDEGNIQSFGSVSYITQTDDIKDGELDEEYISKFGLKDKSIRFMSGGELTRLKIAKSLSKEPSLLLADEPTSNLDLEGINMLVEKLLAFNGGILMVSHDRDILDKVCNQILEIEDGQIKLYKGNYAKYKEQKNLEIKTQELEYEKYIKEKKKLEGAIIETNRKSKSMRKVPKRMGNSEARLHKMGNQNSKRNLENKIKAMETRLEKLGLKEKVTDVDKVKIDISGDEIHSKIVIEGKDIRKSFGNRVLFNNGNFQIYNGTKTALIGDNGSGKTTLLKIILNREMGINISKKAKIGYFDQGLNLLNEDKSIIENLMASSIYDETTVRIILGRLLFKREDVYKQISLLSGGEKVKVNLAKILVSDFNILILDEPTNYLDIYSIEAVEDALYDYNGTILFVSHDRRFIEKIANNIVYIENQRIKTFNGTLVELQNRKEIDNSSEKNLLEHKAILEYRMSEVLGKLSMAAKDEEIEALDKEYKEILEDLNRLK